MVKSHVNDASGLLLLCLILPAGGCGKSPGGLTSLDPSAAADKAVATYDKDANGQLSMQELKACPGIAAAVEHYDKDRSGSVSADEIAQRIRVMQQMPRDNTPFRCTVNYKGYPLPDAEVRFQPADFQGDSIMPASGRTDEQGRCNMTVDDPARTEQDRLNFGIYCGVYQVEITHASTKIASRYNTESVLGSNVALDTGRIGEAAIFNLSK